MKKYKVLLCMSLVFIIFIMNGCENKIKELPVVTIDVEGFGVIKAELYPDEAPNTVNNFISLIDSGFYNGLKFHRITKSLIQTGARESGPNYTIKGEFKENSFNGNEILHEKGILSMVRLGGDNDSASSQFFILKEDATYMDGTYAAFGKVIEGMDILDKIGKVEVNSENSKPKKEVRIKSITVDKKGVKYDEPKVINK